jgi:hypothetical protein
MKLYVFSFQGYGAPFLCIVAETEGDARRIVAEYIKTHPSANKYIDSSLISKENWPDSYDMEIYEPGQIAFIFGD